MCEDKEQEKQEEPTEAPTGNPGTRDLSPNQQSDHDTNDKK